MTIDEAIRHAEETARYKEHDAEMWNRSAKFWGSDNKYAYSMVDECTKCSDEYRQLAEWLKELKKLRERNTPIKPIETTDKVL